METYASAALGERVVHDADSHLMETPEMLGEFADPDIRSRLASFDFGASTGGQEGMVAKARRKQADAAFRAGADDELMLRKNWLAPGAFLKADRPAALDRLGFRSQLVFNTFWSGYLCRLEHGDDVDLTYGAARAHNRALMDFCSVDPRLLAALYVPLMDPERSVAMAAEAIAMGASALLVPSACPRSHSPSHLDLFPVWAQAQEAGVPVVFHVGGGGRLLDPMYFENGRPKVKDFHGGDENFRSVDYMAIPGPVMQTLATLIIDGVFERFPQLKWGVIEQGASWLPGWMRYLDSAFEAFARHEQRLQALSLRPSEYVRRQVRVTPYPTEDAGWILREAGSETLLFSSDFPHVEGGRNPIKRFEASLSGCSEADRERFYAGNMLDLMGPQLVAM